MTPGKKGATRGLAIEHVVADDLMNWKTNPKGAYLIQKMGYVLPELTGVKARKIPGGNKSDVQVTLQYFYKTVRENLSVKSSGKKNGSNQLTRFYPQDLHDRYGFPQDCVRTLEEWTGLAFWENPYVIPKRILLNEVDPAKVQKLLIELEQIKEQLIRDSFVGLEDLGWFVVGYNADTIVDYNIIPMETAVKLYSQGPVLATPNGKGIKLGHVFGQKKGGDGKRDKDGVYMKPKTAYQIQLKINPGFVLNNKEE